MKAILIDPFNAIPNIARTTVREIEMESDYRAIYDQLSAPGQRRVTMFQAVYPHASGVVGFHPSDVIYVDEEGLLYPFTAGFHLIGFPEPFLIGRGLVMGTTRAGDGCAPKTPIATVMSLTKMGLIAPKV